MAAVCVAQLAPEPMESAFCPPKTPRSRIGWVENIQCRKVAEVQQAGIYVRGGGIRYQLHTANPMNHLTTATPTRASRVTSLDPYLYQRASALVADLLQQLSIGIPSSLSTSTPNDEGSPLSTFHDTESLARPQPQPDCIETSRYRHRRKQKTSTDRSIMDFKVDFGDTSGFQTRGKKKKATKAFDPWADENEGKKDENSANGEGNGNDGNNGGDGAGGAGGDGGGDDNNGGGDDDDDWGFGGSKKNKKKSKKKQEEEEERKKKEEEEAAAASTNVLSWADETNDAAADDDWTLGWGKKTTKTKKKKGADDAPPAVPDAPASSAFQDISLDDSAPKLDFSFDAIGPGTKKESGNSFGWGKSWDFGTIGQAEDKKDNKETDDAWGFSAFGKKDTKKKKNGIEEVKDPDPEPIKEEEDTWGGWGAKSTKKKGKKAEEAEATEADNSFDWGFGSKKKSNILSVLDEEPKAETNKIDDNGDDWMAGAWGAGSKKKAATTKKKTGIEDLSASVDLGLNGDAKTTASDQPADDPWAAFSTKKDKKKTKKGLLDDEFDPLPAAPEPPPAEKDGIWSSFGTTKKGKKEKTVDFETELLGDVEPEPPKEPLVAWDHDLSPKDKKKREREMKKDGTWDSRVTQEMVDEEAAAAEKEAEAAAAALNLIEEEVVTAPEPKVAWDSGLSPKEKKKKEKQMKLDGTWDDRITQEMIDEEEAAAAAAAEEAALANEIDILESAPDPPEPKKAWDEGLNVKEKKRKEKQMRLDGTWDDRITQEMIEEEEAAAAVAALEAEITAAPEQEENDSKSASVEKKVAWDHDLSPKEKRKKEKEMKIQGTWEDRVTQEQIEEEEAAAAAAKEEEDAKAAEKAKEPLIAWDSGLSPKDKRKKEKEMRLNGTWNDRVTQDMVDEQEAAAAEEAARKAEEESAAAAKTKEPLVAWDFDLSPKEKRKKEKEMRLNGTWDDRITQDMVDADAEAAAAEPEPEPESSSKDLLVEEERFPWDHDLTPKEKRKKEKEMKLNGTWETRLTQEQIDADAAAAKAEPEPEPDNTWGSIGGFGTKDKKKKSSTAFESLDEDKDDLGWGGTWGFGSKKSKDKSASAEKEPITASLASVKEDKVEDIWDFGLSSKDKKKKETTKKKSLLSSLDEVPDPEPVISPPAEDDIWGSWAKTDTKSKKGKKAAEPPPPAPTPPAQGLTPERQATEAPDIDELDWAGLDSGKKTTKKDDGAKRSSIWGFGASTSTSKTKKEREAKAKKEAEEKEEEERKKREAEEAEAARLAEEEAAKSSKKSKLGKTSKASKSDEKKKSDDLLDLLDDPVPTSASTKLKKTSTKGSEKVEDSKVEEPKASTDYFGFWGSGSSSKKTAGKKDTDTKKEIKRQGSTNEDDALNALADEFEFASINDKPKTSSSKLTKTMSNDKPKFGTSVADRIKAFEGPKEGVGKKSKVSEASPPREEPTLEETLKPKEEKKASKSKATTPKSSKTKVDAKSSPVLAADEKKSKETIPGGFPGAFGDEDDLLGAEDPPADSKAKKSSKTSKTTKTSSKAKKTEEATERSMDPIVKKSSKSVDLLDDSKLPTPPPEDKQSSKKERPRVERASTTSWGFWGSTPPPKTPSKTKPLEEDSAAESKKTKSPPALARSKSTRTPKEKEREEKKEAEKAKLSESDREGSKKMERSKSSRGKGFASFMLGSAPPSAMKTKPLERRSSIGGSKTSSRRQSIDDSGLLSPPPDDEPVNSKAAKVMGMKSSKVKRTTSVKDKSKSYADPYPIDDDDMVMINADDKPSTAKKSKAKVGEKLAVKTKSTKPRSKTLSGEEDVVMVDAQAADGQPPSSPEDPDATSNQGGAMKRATGFFGSFFSTTKTVPVEVPRSSPATDVEDGGLPIRTKGGRRRSKAVDGPEDLTTDAPMDTDADLEARRAERKAKRDAKVKAEEEERQAREQKRRERRDREKADLEARREKARDQARREREAEDARREEKRARRKEREVAEQERVAQEEAEAEAAAGRRREERRKMREKLEAEQNVKPVTKEDRRRTYAGEEEDRRVRYEDRKTRVKDKSSRRRSTALMEEYHESRSGSGKGTKPPEDKTSSWIDSQKDEPPDMPPVAETVLDPSGQTPRRPDDVDMDSRRRHKDRYAGMTEDEIAEYRARKRAQRKAAEKSTSGGSDERDKRKSNRRSSRIVEDDFEPVKTFDGRPSFVRNDSKRSSFLGKFF